MDKSRDAYEYLATGDAWNDFCEEMKGFAEDILRETAPKEPVDLAEAHRFLTRHMRSAFELIMEGGDASRPWFFTSLHETMKIGWDNPDNVHTNAYLNGRSTYRVWGKRGDSHYMTLGLYAGSFGGGGRSTSNYVHVDDLDVKPDGSFECFLSATEQPYNWVRIDPETTTLMVRETFWDKLNEERATLNIECLDRDGPPPPLDPHFVVNAMRRSIRYVRGANKMFFDMSDMWREKPNTFWESDPVVAAQSQGIVGAYYSSGWWKCAPDEAIVCDVMPPECRYWGFVLSNYWGESLEYRYRQLSTNKKRATYRPDGSWRIVLAHSDPGAPAVNWMDTEGHDEGIWTLRWLEADSHPLPTVRVVKLADVASLD